MKIGRSWDVSIKNLKNKFQGLQQASILMLKGGICHPTPPNGYGPDIKLEKNLMNNNGVTEKFGASCNSERLGPS